MNFRSVADLNAAIVRNLTRIPHVDIIIGIPRSGTLAASLVALHTQRGKLVPFGTRIDPCARVLLVDDSIWTGATMRISLSQYPTALPLAVYGVKASPRTVTVLENCAQPRMFEWNLWRSSHLDTVAVDLDGVLCEDPTCKVESFRRFARTATPKFLPTRKVRAVVTCRLEKYRRETEAWLESYGVRVDRLCMMDYPTETARQRDNRHAAWKAEQCSKLGVALFVESSAKQAAVIAKRLGRPVWCVETLQLYGGAA